MPLRKYQGMCLDVLSPEGWKDSVVVMVVPCLLRYVDLVYMRQDLLGVATDSSVIRPSVLIPPRC